MASPDTQLATADQDSLSPRRRTLTKTARQGIGWLYWIAGISVFNTLLYRLGVKLCFVVGLGATQFVDGASAAIAEHVGHDDRLIYAVAACVIDVLLVGAFFLAARSALRVERRLMLAAIVFYALDAGLLVWGEDWLAVAFHGLALWALWRGYTAIGELGELERQASAGGASPEHAVRPEFRIEAPSLPEFELGGMPQFTRPDPSEPKPTGLHTRVDGIPALITGLVVAAGLAAFAFVMSKY